MASRSKKAGTIFPVGRIQKYLKKLLIAHRISPGAAVYLAATLEYLASEVLELSGNAAYDNRSRRILPRHIKLATKYDEDLAKLVGKHSVMAGGGQPAISFIVLPKMHQPYIQGTQD